MYRSKLLRSLSFRVATAYAALFSVSVLMLFGIIYWATVDSIQGQVENEIRAEFNALVGERSAEGVQGMADAIEERVDGDLSGAYLLLQGADARPIAGNLPAMQPRDGWIDLLPPEDPTINRKHSEHVVHGKGRILDDGSFLFVGRDTHPLRQLREIIVHGFLACGIATIAIALSLGALTSAGVMRRLRAISFASAEIMRGDLSRRLVIGPRSDEFDELAGHVNAMLDRIQSLIEDLQQVSNDIAHDLRTPLTRLHQRLELALTVESRPCGATCPITGEIEKAIDEADLLLGTFSAMLRIAQIDSGSRRAGFRTVDLSYLLHSLIETYGPVAEDARHQISAKIAPGISIEGDAELLTQMFANLIENAIKHTAEGSRIGIGLTCADRFVVASVADDGPGIPAALCDRVCKRFVRLETSRTTLGSGLGLSLVAAVARLHEIDFDLGDNQPGLRVSLRIPDPQAVTTGR